MRVALLWIACAAILSGCGGTAAQKPAPSPTPLLIESRGISMALTKAVHLIGFRAQPPRAQVLSVAVIPPLGGDDTPANRGIAYEYAGATGKWLLSEWPAQKFHIVFAAGDASSVPCAPVAYSSNAVAWTTHDGLAMTLQPDGPASLEMTTAQARGVLARMGCR